jgi:hypothetical protein
MNWTRSPAGFEFGSHFTSSFTDILICGCRHGSSIIDEGEKLGFGLLGFSCSRILALTTESSQPGVHPAREPKAESIVFPGRIPPPSPGNLSRSSVLLIPCFFYHSAVGGTAGQPPSDQLLRARQSRDLMMLIFIKESPGELALGAV